MKKKIDLSPEELAEAASIRLRFQLTAVTAVLVLGIGTVVYHFVEKLSWLNSIYFSTITLTTVGYGDITPKTDTGKVFTIFYVFVGIGILATFASLFVKNAVARRAVHNSQK